MRRPLRRLAVAAIGLVVAAGVALGWTHFHRRQPSAIEKTAAQRAAQARQAARRAGLPRSIQDLLGRAAGAVGQSFTVTYRTSQGTTATLTQRPPAKRVDESEGSGAAVIVRTLIVNADGSFSCVRRQGAWTCQRAAGAPAALGTFSPSELKATVDRLASQRTEFRFAVVHRRVAGTRATCLVTTPIAPTTSSPTGTLCISAQGAPLLVNGSAGRLEATSYKASAPSQVFRLPVAAG